jgi:hypothetical protein
MTPEMREELETEAVEDDMTLSAYIEYVLTFRMKDRSIYDVHDALIDDYNALIDDYNSLIDKYELDQPVVEEDVIFPWLSPAVERRIEDLLKILRKVYPNCKREEMLLGVLEVAVEEVKKGTLGMSEYLDRQMLK